jgi:hypothetical protein
MPPNTDKNEVPVSTSVPSQADIPPISTPPKSNNKWYKISKTKIELLVLIILVTLIPLGIWSNAFAYEYYYLKCQDQPMELEGKYYRLPADKGYGIHPGSDYHVCDSKPPQGYTRDLSTIAGKAFAKEAQFQYERLHPKPNYALYIPEGHSFSALKTITGGGGKPVTNFYVATPDNLTFTIQEMTKDNDFSYTNLCTKPGDANWTGTVIAHDSADREICRVNPSKYITSYFAGINIGNTAVMLSIAKDPTTDLTAQVTAIFSAMKPYLNNTKATLSETVAQAAVDQQAKQMKQLEQQQRDLQIQQRLQQKQQARIQEDKQNAGYGWTE